MGSKNTPMLDLFHDLMPKQISVLTVFHHHRQFLNSWMSFLGINVSQRGKKSVETKNSQSLFPCDLYDENDA
jgi:hypothetical protein